MSIKDLQLEQQPIETQHLIARFTQVEKALITETPELPTALATIHKLLQEHEELTHIFDDDDIAIIHQAFEKYKGVEMIKKSAKKSSPKRKLSDNDLTNL